MFGHCIVTGQYPRLEIAKEPLPQKGPVAQALPQQQSKIDPDAAFAAILNADQKTRVATLEALGLEWMKEVVVSDARMLAVNLDGDEDLERVLIVEGTGQTGVILFDRLENTWWEVGTFISQRARNPFIELIPIVRYGTNDIVLHSGGSQGTGLGQINLTIYRMLGGKVYPVFETIKNAWNLSGSEDSRVAYPDPETFTDPRVITLRRVKQVGQRKTTTCTPYRWDPNQFAFVKFAGPCKQ